MAAAAIRPDAHPDVVGLRERVATLQAHAFRLVDAARQRADARPGDRVWGAVGRAARAIFDRAERRAISFAPGELEARVAAVERASEASLRALDRELVAVAARFADRPDRAEAIAREIMGIEMAEVTRVGVEFNLWVEGRAEAAWEDAVRRLRGLLSRGLDRRP